MREIIKKSMIIILILLSQIIFAQEKGKIEGFIKDRITQQPLISANIILEGTNIGSTTNEKGYFSISDLPVGLYRLKISYIGYRSKIIPEVMVLSSKPTFLNIMMDEEAINLKGVTVTSGYFNTDITEQISIKQFSYEELRRTPGGFEDVVRALSVIPGVAKQSAGRNDLIVRGGAPSENLYLVDGFVVPNINHFATQGATGGTNSYIDLDFVGNTKFSTGGFSAKYGDKLSSVLDLKLREPRKDKIGGKALISASQFGFNSEGPLSESSDFLFSLRRSYLDFIFNAAGFSFVPQYWDMLFKYNFKPDNKNKFSFLFVGAKDDINFNIKDKEDRFDNARILANEQRQYTAGFSYRRILSNGVMNLRLGRNYTNYNSFQNDTTSTAIFKNKSKESELFFDADFFFKITGKSDVNFGINSKLIKTDYDIYFPDKFETSFGEVLPVNKIKTRKDFYKFAAFANYSFNLLDKIEFNLGLRGDYFSGIENNLSIAPRVSLSYMLSPVSKINFSTGIYYQAPSYIWLLYGNNNKLNFIKVNQFILGFEHLLSEDIQFITEVFYKDYSKYPTSKLRNYLTLFNTGVGFGGAESNFSSYGFEPLSSSGSGYSRGIEFSIQKKSSEVPLYGIASLTLSSSEFKALDKIQRKSAFDQSVIFSLTAGYMLDNSWIFSMKFRYASGLPFTPYHNFGKQKVDEYLSENLPATHGLDLRIDKIWNFSSSSLIAYFDVQNVYNKKNITGKRWDYYKMKPEDQKEFGILPTIGISYEF